MAMPSKPEKPPAEKRACEDATGIAACESVDRYTEEALKLAQVPMDPAERAQALLELANGEPTSTWLSRCAGPAREHLGSAAPPAASAVGLVAAGVTTRV